MMIAARVAAAGAALAAVVAVGASAQPPPGGVDVGGTVPSTLELGLAEPKDSGGELRIAARVTASDAPTQLSVVGGDDAERVLAQWRRPVSKAASTVRLRQDRGLVLVTVSAETP